MQTSKFGSVLWWVYNQLEEAKKVINDNSHQQTVVEVQSSIKRLCEKEDVVQTCDTVAQSCSAAAEAGYAVLIQRLRSEDKPIKPEDEEWGQDISSQ